MTMLPPEVSIDPDDARWLRGALDKLTTQRTRLKVSEWAEQKRYIPPELTNLPGKWKNSVAPYLVEIMDALGPDHPARKIAVMKGGQVCATTGLLENFIGYTIDHDPSGLIYASADKELTQLGMVMKIDRMLQHSGLTGVLGPGDGSTKRSGNTADLKEFPGGFLMAIGGRSPAKARSTAAKKALIDELDGMPAILGQVGKEEGGFVGLIEKRTDTYHDTRKILYLSTPLKTATSLIHPLYLAGDQRCFYVPCVSCNFFQKLEWHGTLADGKVYGIVFEHEGGKLIEESVGYQCRACDHIMRNHDKTRFLADGKWVAESETEEEGLISYHIPALLSPVGMYPWVGIVKKWFKAWDVVQDRPRDIDDLQQFYNLERGLPWEDRGQAPKFEVVQQRRRITYTSGTIPNNQIEAETGAPAMLLTAGVDIHAERIDCEVTAWCFERQTYSIDWFEWKGDTEDTSDEGPWKNLEELIENQTYVADDGRHYKVALTLIDVGYGQRVSECFEFITRYSQGVFGVMGRDLPARGSLVREWSTGTSKTGNMLFNVTAPIYKDRISSWIKKEWKPDQLQPEGYLNFPADYPDEFFRMYESEHKVEKIDPRTKKRLGFKWEQIGQRPNHAWDCRVYASCGYDMIASEVCQQVLGLDKLDHEAFANYAVPRRNPAGKWIASPFSWHPEEVAA